MTARVAIGPEPTAGSRYIAQDYKFICNAANAPGAEGMAGVVWVFYVSKILDFFDTIFMVVRGRWENGSRQW